MGESGAGRAGLTAAGWSQLHYGIDPDRVPLLRGWLRLVWAIARPLKRIPPLAVTIVGAIVAAVAVFAVPWVALVLVLLAVLCDALDGALALAAGRASKVGAVADKAADRVADTAFALVVWQCGAPLWLALLAAGISLAHEASREVRGGPSRTLITVNERPTRTICTVLACATSTWGPWAPTTCACVWLALGLVALGQLGSRIARG
jgi:CDP-diacylglycerol--glycerol-3-phosphate 3-phosphatidyltransferase